MLFFVICGSTDKCTRYLLPGAARSREWRHRLQVSRRCHTALPPHNSEHLSLVFWCDINQTGFICSCIYLFWREGCKHIRYWFGAVPASSGLNPSIVWNITWHQRGTPFFLEKIYRCSASAVTSLAFVLFILSFFFATWCFCFPISSSPLSWFIEIEVLITAQANLELTEYLPHGITRKTKPVYFLSIKYRWPFLFYFFSVFATSFHQFMTWMTRKTRHLKNF